MLRGTKFPAAAGDKCSGRGGVHRAPCSKVPVMSNLQLLLGEVDRLRQFPRAVVVLVLCVGAVVWAVSSWYYRRTISNLETHVGLLQGQLDVRPAPRPGPLPSYSLGGSDLLIYKSGETWIYQEDTQTRVELDWGSLADIDADAVLRMRTEGGEGWVQGRIVTRHQW